jgi:hypothetical protein
VLGYIYIFAVAKPVSMRRLSALFVLGLLLATPILGILNVSNALRYALWTATALTFVVWSMPLLRIAYSTFRNRALTLDALLPVSAVVQLTYWFVLAFLPVVAIGKLLCPTQALQIAALPRLVAIACLAALAFQGWMLSLVSMRRHVKHPRRSPSS